MLVHRLPLDQFELQSCSEAPPVHRCEPIKRFSLSRTLLLLKWLDGAGAAVLVAVLCDAFPASQGSGALRFITLLAAALGTWLVAGSMARLYDPRHVDGDGTLAFRAVAACLLTFGPMVLIASIIVIPLAKLPFIATAAAGFVAWILITRMVWLAYIRSLFRRGACLDRVIVLDQSTSSAQALAARIERLTQGRVRVAASASMPGLPDSPSVAWIEGTVRSGYVERIVIAESLEPDGLSHRLLFQLLHANLDVTFIPRKPISGGSRLCFSASGSGLSIVGVADCALSNGQLACKRAIDVAVSAVALAVLGIGLAAIAVAIKFDSPGPVLFRQKRAGLLEAEFSVFKFRTMYHNLRDADAKQQTSRNDKRVTRVGRFLRRTSLDELPQLVNVLLGHMSIVGPRPHARGMTVSGVALTALVGGYTERHRVRPGITGWAQVNGSRGEVDTARKLRRRIALDCYYIENWSLGLDIKIIARTAALLLFDNHAY